MARFRLLVSLAALGLILVLAPAARAGVFNPETFALDNGMEVVVVPNQRAPVVVHMVWYRVGSADDPLGKSGVAHFLEHLMFKGTETYPEGEFNEIVARNGGRQNAFTSYDYTGYYQKVAKDRLALMMELEADRMANLVLTDDKVLPERKVVLEERRSRTENEPGALLREHINAVQYLAHPYRIPVIGWEHEIRGLTTEDARAFYQRYYAPDNAILVVAGDITAAELKPLAEATYGRVPAAGVGPRQRVGEPPQLAARRVELRDARVSQPAWNRSYLAPTYGSGDQAHALEVLAEIIGGSTTSRLYRALVIDQQVAAGAGAWYDGANLDLSRFGFWATPSPGVEVAAVEAAIDAEIARLLADGVTAQEVERVTTRLVREAIYARDSLSTAARTFGAALASGQTIKDVESWPDRIAAVTVEAVNAAARAVLRPGTSVTGVLLPDETG